MADTSPEAPGKLQQLQAEMQTLINEDAVAEQEPQLSWAQRFVHFWILVIRNFLRNRCLVRASALAYTTLLALVPLLAVSISVASLFLPRDEAKQKEKLPRGGGGGGKGEEGRRVDGGARRRRSLQAPPARG